MGAQRARGSEQHYTLLLCRKGISLVERYACVCAWWAAERAQAATILVCAALCVCNNSLRINKTISEVWQAAAIHTPFKACRAGAWAVMH